MCVLWAPPSAGPLAQAGEKNKNEKHAVAHYLFPICFLLICERCFDSFLLTTPLFFFTQSAEVFSASPLDDYLPASWTPGLLDLSDEWSSTALRSSRRVARVEEALAQFRQTRLALRDSRVREAVLSASLHVQEQPPAREFDAAAFLSVVHRDGRELACDWDLLQLRRRVDACVEQAAREAAANAATADAVNAAAVAAANAAAAANVKAQTQSKLSVNKERHAKTSAGAAGVSDKSRSKAKGDGTTGLDDVRLHLQQTQTQQQVSSMLYLQQQQQMMLQRQRQQLQEERTVQQEQQLLEQHRLQLLYQHRQLLLLQQQQQLKPQSQPEQPQPAAAAAPQVERVGGLSDEQQALLQQLQAQIRLIQEQQAALQEQLLRKQQLNDSGSDDAAALLARAQLQQQQSRLQLPASAAATPSVSPLPSPLKQATPTPAIRHAAVQSMPPRASQADTQSALTIVEEEVLGLLMHQQQQRPRHRPLSEEELRDLVSNALDDVVSQAVDDLREAAAHQQVGVELKYFLLSHLTHCQQDPIVSVPNFCDCKFFFLPQSIHTFFIFLFVHSVWPTKRGGRGRSALATTMRPRPTSRCATSPSWCRPCTSSPCPPRRRSWSRPRESMVNSRGCRCRGEVARVTRLYPQRRRRRLTLAAGRCRSARCRRPCRVWQRSGCARRSRPPQNMPTQTPLH